MNMNVTRSDWPLVVVGAVIVALAATGTAGTLAHEAQSLGYGLVNLIEIIVLSL
jgi:hypothetical protein